MYVNIALSLETDPLRLFHTAKNLAYSVDEIDNYNNEVAQRVSMRDVPARLRTKRAFEDTTPMSRITCSRKREFQVEILVLHQPRKFRRTWRTLIENLEIQYYRIHVIVLPCDVADIRRVNQRLRD